MKPLPARSEAVKVAKRDLSGFCDKTPKVRWEWPELTSAAPEPGPGWTWVNIWATWCGPCIEEMPMLVKWQADMEKRGIEVALQLLSADAEATALPKFYARNKDFPKGVQIADSEAFPEWLESMGGSHAAGLPAHFFIDSEGQVACARAGAFTKGNQTDLRQLLR